MYAPVRGFGKLWREQLAGPVSALGWATAPERGTTLLIQAFANGLLFQDAVTGGADSEDGVLWVLYRDGTWAKVGE